MYFGRGVNKVQNPYTLKDMYVFYLNEIGDNPLYKLEYHEYVDIVSDYLKLTMTYILEESGIFDMGFRIGKCSVIKKNYKFDDISKESVDWPLTNKLGKRIFHLNEHSRGVRYGFYWNKKNKFLRNIKLYRLVFTRTNRRRLAQLIKSGEYDYYEKE